MFNFWHSGALALSPERQIARMSKIKNGGLDQYGAKPFEQRQFRTPGVERVKFYLQRRDDDDDDDDDDEFVDRYCR